MHNNHTHYDTMNNTAILEIHVDSGTSLDFCDHIMVTARICRQRNLTKTKVMRPLICLIKRIETICPLASSTEINGYLNGKG